MRPPRTFPEIVTYTIGANRVEPVKRIKDMDPVPRGFRNRAPEPRHVVHRYEIAGGFPVRRLIAENLSIHNALLKRLTQKQ